MRNYLEQFFKVTMRQSAPRAAIWRLHARFIGQLFRAVLGARLIVDYKKVRLHASIQNDNLH